MRPLVHEPMKTVSTSISRIGVPAVRPMYSSARSAATRSLSSSNSCGIGHRAGQRHALAGVGAPRDERRDLGGVERDDLVELGVVVGDEARPVGDRLVPRLTLRRVRAALDVVERRLVGGDEAGLGAPLDRHVADRHAGFHRQLADGLAAVLHDVALAAAGGLLRDEGEDQVLGGGALGQLADDLDGHHLGPRLRQRLGGEHVLDLAGADAERDGAERAVRGRVGVAAHDRHARLGEAELRADDVHDALVEVAHRVDPDAELLGVAAQRLDLQCARPGRRSACRGRSSGCCGPRWRASGRDVAPAGRRGAARRRPAGW